MTIAARPRDSETIFDVEGASEGTDERRASLPREDGHATPRQLSEVTRGTSAGGYRFARREELEAIGLLLGILIVLLVASATIGSPPG